jgi:hypothetical protein
MKITANRKDSMDDQVMTANSCTLCVGQWVSQIQDGSSGPAPD